MLYVYGNPNEQRLLVALLVGLIYHYIIYLFFKENQMIVSEIQGSPGYI